MVFNVRLKLKLWGILHGKRHESTPNDVKCMRGVPVCLKREQMPTYSIRNLRKKYVLIHS